MGCCRTLRISVTMTVTNVIFRAISTDKISQVVANSFLRISQSRVRGTKSRVIIRIISAPWEVEGLLRHLRYKKDSSNETKTSKFSALESLNKEKYYQKIY